MKAMASDLHFKKYSLIFMIIKFDTKTALT